MNPAVQKGILVARPPVVVVMGHIDHGKSTLLDFIRKSNVVAHEAGGITQHMSAYEVVHKSKEGTERHITFIDTPGHEAFSALRKRGASVADVAILVVSAEDGVKPQTLEALESIRAQDMPYIVAINKIDKPEARVERTFQNLAENEIYVEGYGGNIPVVAVSAKTGQGMPELLDMILLVSELEELKADPATTPEGVVIESNIDPKKGLSATLIVLNGTLMRGMFVATQESATPVRIMENFLGEKIDEATFSSPVRIIGWNKLPKVGSVFKGFNKKDEAIEFSEKASVARKSPSVDTRKSDSETQMVTIPIIIKADRAGSLEAVIYEIEKIKEEKIRVRIIDSGLGAVSESDVRLASANKDTLIIGFHTKVDTVAKNLADRDGVSIQVFDIIYKLTDWLKSVVKERTPKTFVDEITGTAKVVRIFSKNKDRQIVGGKVEIGSLMVGESVKILRRESEIGRGRVRGLQQQKKDVGEVKEGSEYGALVESKIEIVPGDKLLSFKTVEK